MFNIPQFVTKRINDAKAIPIKLWEIVVAEFFRFRVEEYLLIIETSTFNYS